MKKVSIPIFTFCLILSSCATSKRAQQEVSITATQWKLITVATSSKELKPSEENPVTLKIENNQASGNSGCNYFSGPVELKEKSLKFGDLASTRKYCMESMEIENAVLKALSETDNYRIKDNKLELRKGSQTLATFAIAN